MKIVCISMCSECPHFIKADDDGQSAEPDYMCDMANLPLRKDLGDYYIPKWCPLEDAGDDRDY